MNYIVYEFNCWTANPIYLHVYESLNCPSFEKYRKDANKDYRYGITKTPNLPFKATTGEQTAMIYTVPTHFKAGDKVYIKCKETFGAMNIIKVIQRKAVKLAKGEYRKDGFVYLEKIILGEVVK